MQSFYEDLEVSRSLVLLTDSSDAKGLSGRRGLGASRHMSTRFLWLQDRVAARHLAIYKVPTDDNLADLGNKALAGPTAEKYFPRLGLVFSAP